VQKDAGKPHRREAEHEAAASHSDTPPCENRMAKITMRTTEAVMPVIRLRRMSLREATKKRAMAPHQ